MINFAKSSAALGLSACVLVVVGCSGAGSSSGGGGTTTPPPVVPAVTSITPTTTMAGSSSLTLTINGTNFLSSSTVQVGGAAEATTFVSATELTANVQASQLAAGGQLAVIVLNGATSSGSGAAVNLQVTNPSPTLTALSPTAVGVGLTSATVTVTGTNFVTTSTVQVNGSARPTAFVSSKQLNVTLQASDMAAGGSLTLTVVNATPGGGTSGALTLGVSNPAPGPQISLSPYTVVTGATPTPITVTGTNFSPSSVVQWAAVPQATTYVSPTQLTFHLTAAEQATAGQAYVTVVTPAPGGGTSGAVPLFIAAATAPPVITSIDPSTFVVGSGDTTITVYGTGFVASLGGGYRDVFVAQVLWNGKPLTMTGGLAFSPADTFVQATVPASLLASLGTAQVTVTTSTNPTTSNAVTATIANPPAPTLASISPASVPINTATPLTLNGTGFTQNSTVALNGTNVAATYVSSTQLTVNLPASAVTLPGNVNVTVTTPAPGGGTSGPLALTAYIGIANNDIVYDGVSGLFYVSVPSSAGAPYGNTVVSVDPETGALGTPIPVGSEPNRLAISSDGQTLWVGLDGASAVRQVNLATGTAGMQFTLGGNSGVYANPPTVAAMAVLPGAPNSVVVALNGGGIGNAVSLGIYDSGVLRGTGVTGYTSYPPLALQVNGTTSEVYAAAYGTYTVYTYSATGLTQKGTANNGNYVPNNLDDLVVTGGRTYTDFGTVYDAEAGALLGTFYSSGTTAASGPVAVDTTQGLAFVLDYGQGATPFSGTPQIQAFNVTTFNASTPNVLPVSITPTAFGTIAPSHLTRWGTNGLAFRTASGVYSLRSNFVKDLSQTSADLSVELAQSGGAATGGNTTYTATVTNNGPSASTNIALTAQVPSTGVLVTVTPSAGTCSAGAAISCDLGGLANGASATVSFVVMQMTAGSATMNVQVSGSETDPVLTNNQASASTTTTGSAYNAVPSLQSISPNGVEAGASDTTLTVTGTGFSSGSTVYLGTTALATTFTSATALSATVPSAQLASLGWAAVTVANPSPGGGASNPLPLTVFSVITLGANHILYDPYSQNIMASVGSGSATVAGNSIVAITPSSAKVGTAVPIGSQPTNLALTSDGQILYTVLAGSESVARYNMLTQAAEFTYAVPANTSFDGGIALRGIATQPGTENTIALDIASFSGNAIYDFDPATKTAAIRGQASGPYSGSCIKFLDATDMFAFDVDTSGATFDHYTVGPTGFVANNYSQYTQSTLNGFGCFQLSGGLAFANAGGIANPATVPATQIGVMKVNGGGTFSTSNAFAADASLQRAFYLADTSGSGTSQDGLQAFDTTTFLPTASVFLNIPTVEGNTSYAGVDAVRWGQDGLALLTSGGHIYLLRGAAVVPGLLGQSTAAVLTSSATTTVTHGAGNTLLTLTGSNFLPGVAVTWNGSYRTTTIVDASHVTVAIPASDLAAAGTGSLVATNPGAPASGGLTVTIN